MAAETITIKAAASIHACAVPSGIGGDRARRGAHRTAR